MQFKVLYIIHKKTHSKYKTGNKNTPNIEDKKDEIHKIHYKMLKHI